MYRNVGTANQTTYTKSFKIRFMFPAIWGSFVLLSILRRLIGQGAIEHLTHYIKLTNIQSRYINWCGINCKPYGRPISFECDVTRSWHSSSCCSCFWFAISFNLYLSDIHWISNFFKNLIYIFIFLFMSNYIIF